MVIVEMVLLWVFGDQVGAVVCELLVECGIVIWIVVCVVVVGVGWLQFDGGDSIFVDVVVVLL